MPSQCGFGEDCNALIDGFGGSCRYNPFFEEIAYEQRNILVGLYLEIDALNMSTFYLIDSAIARMQIMVSRSTQVVLWTDH